MDGLHREEIVVGRAHLNVRSRELVILVQDRITEPDPGTIIKLDLWLDPGITHLQDRGFRIRQIAHLGEDLVHGLIEAGEEDVEGELLQLVDRLHEVRVRAHDRSDERDQRSI